MAKPRDLTPIRISLIYICLGSLWILFSDSALHFLVDNPAAAHKLQTIKGWLFILVTGALVYGLSRAMHRSLEVEIQERQRAQSDLNDALVEAERANQAKTEFLATLSHEFRTPLNAILGFSEMLRAQYHGPLGSDHYAGYIENIRHSGAHMLTLISNVLDISTIESGRLALNLAAFDIQDMIQDCVKNFRVEAQEKDITIELEAGCRMMYADRLRVSQIVTNLLSNAIKFTGGGGRVSVVARPANDWVTITVTDTGVGIPPDLINKVTEPFTQAHLDPYVAQEGSGQGLSIVKALAEAHGGGLEITSTTGKGTAVAVHFPKAITPGA